MDIDIPRTIREFLTGMVHDIQPRTGLLMINEIIDNFDSYFVCDVYKDGKFGYGYRILCADTHNEPTFGFLSVTKEIKMVTPRDTSMPPLIGLTLNSFTPVTTAIVATIYMMFSFNFMLSQPNGTKLNRLNIPPGFGGKMVINRKRREWKGIAVVMRDKDGNKIKSDLFEDYDDSLLYSFTGLKEDADLDQIYSGPVIMSLVHFWVKSSDQVTVNYTIRKIELHPYRLTVNPLYDMPPKKV